MTIRIGSLCSGYGGLEAAVQATYGGTVAWHCENDKAASEILAHHHPDVPNHGDITTVDWSAVEPVDVLTAGFPCQPVSHAGKRLGDQDERWLWDDCARAVRDLRPRFVVLENVRGLLTAKGGKLFGQVLGSLAECGYDARWVGVRASDAGAAHGRFRIFIAAHPTGDGRHEGRPQPARLFGRPDAAIGGHGSAADAGGQRHGGGQDPRGMGRVDGEDEGCAQQRQRAWSEPVDRGAAAAADTDRDGPQSLGWIDTLRRHADGRCGADIAWGQYEPAIRRWERALGRPAPAPTQPGTNGKLQLSPRFVEWHMGLPPGHVTGVPGISRNDQLKALGNGVVPQQAALALRLLVAGREIIQEAFR